MKLLVKKIQPSLELQDLISKVSNAFGKLQAIDMQEQKPADFGSNLVALGKCLLEICDLVSIFHNQKYDHKKIIL
jgi:hypothetical protein